MGQRGAGVAKVYWGAWWTKGTVAEEAPCKEKVVGRGWGKLDWGV